MLATGHKIELIKIPFQCTHSGSIIEYDIFIKLIVSVGVGEDKIGRRTQ